MYSFINVQETTRQYHISDCKTRQTFHEVEWLPVLTVDERQVIDVDKCLC